MMNAHASPYTIPIVEGLVWAASAVAGRRPRVGPIRAGTAAGRFHHSEWDALLGRFVQDGAIDYHNMVRVRRLVEVYLQRLAETDPEAFIDSDDQLAFYLNAYNAIAIHQVLIAYPITTIRNRPNAFLRPYPIGQRNVSLHSLHSNILRTFTDPRIHFAICNTAHSSPVIVPYAFTGANLQAELDTALRNFLTDETRGLRFEAVTNTLIVSPLLRLFGGDIVRPWAMPRAGNLLWGWSRLRDVLHTLEPVVPHSVRVAQRKLRIQVAPYDWSLNDRSSRGTHPAIPG